jgi:BirA family transcriptional regulator, biotin operon repressor / biotin---[acetyl-CoA-carboxylase] ligase
MSGISLTTDDIRRQCREDLEARLQGGSTLDVEKIHRYGAFVGSVVECHPSLARAMEYCRDLITATEQSGHSVHSGTVVLADRLSRSRGRFDRTWHAPAGGVWGCLIHANTLLESSRRFVTLAVGVACCEAVRELGGEGAVLRWVNDVLVDGRKLAGFLVEGFTGPCFGEEYNLIGFGININNSCFPAELQHLAISLAEVLGHPVDLNLFSRVFLAKLSFALGLLCHEEDRHLHEESSRTGGHPLLARWRELSDSPGRQVVYGLDVLTNPQYQAFVVDISADGGLILRFADGHEKIEYCGEIRYL